MVRNILLLMIVLIMSGYAQEFLEITPKTGDGAYSILRRFDIPTDTDNINLFISLNSGNLGRNNAILKNRTYVVPVKVYQYNGKSIRTTIGNDDWDYAVSIQKYNESLHSKGIKKADYRDDNILWVPSFSFDYLTDLNRNDVADKKNDEPTFLIEKLFGKKYERVDIIDYQLKGNVYYLVSGHGGPDPGAVGYKNGYELHEDEYAYDVTLRLARNLMAHGATVYIIVQDPNDGIRDEYYLNNSYSEYYYGNQPISSNQLERLRKRVEIINDLYRQNQNTARKQRAIVFHVDSRYTGQRIDIFFYHAPGSEEGRAFSTTLLNTITEKYDAVQPGRGYDGTVSGRGLYMTRNTLPITSFIEIGNIQNPLDQQRILQYNNRQAIANWLLDGVIRFDK